MDNKARDRLMVGKLDRYTAFDWGQVDHGGDPLNVVLNRRMPVYVKVDRTRYIARTKSTMALLMDNVHRFFAMPSLPPSHGVSWDGDVYLLALGDASIREILATGDCSVTTFENGGLRLSPPTSDHAEDCVHGVDALHEEVRFKDCYLVEKRLLKVSSGDADSEDWQSLRERCAIRMPIRRDDLYLEESEVALLQRQGKSAWTCVECAMETPDRRLPLAIFWMYQAAVALNRGQKVSREEVKKWLQENAPVEVWRKRWLRTAASIIPLDGGLSKKINRTSGSALDAAPSISSEHVGRALRLVLVLADWWQTQVEKGGSPRNELAGTLEDAGFGAIAIIDIVGMISGYHLVDDEEKKLKDYLGRRGG